MLSRATAIATPAVRIANDNAAARAAHRATTVVPGSFAKPPAIAQHSAAMSATSVAVSSTATGRTHRAGSSGRKENANDRHATVLRIFPDAETAKTVPSKAIKAIEVPVKGQSAVRSRCPEDTVRFISQQLTQPMLVVRLQSQLVR